MEKKDYDYYYQSEKKPNHRPGRIRIQPKETRTEAYTESLKSRERERPIIEIGFFRNSSQMNKEQDGWMDTMDAAVRPIHGTMENQKKRERKREKRCTIV